MAKKKQPKPDIQATFATEECSSNFVIAFHEQFSNCKCEMHEDKVSVSIWAPKKVLPQIRLLTENNRFCRRSISVYTAC